MGRLAIRRVEYLGDVYTFDSGQWPDGLVVVEGSNGSGKTTLTDLIYFALGGSVHQFTKRGSQQHKEIREDANNAVRVTIETNGSLHSITRRFDAPEDIMVVPHKGEPPVVLPVSRRDDRRVFSDWLLGELGIPVVTLFHGTYRGKLNFTDLMRLIYYDQDPDPSKVFKRPDQQNFVSDSLDFRRAIFEILLGSASEKYYQKLGELRLAQSELTERRTASSTYGEALARASRATTGSPDGANADFLKSSIAEKEAQLRRLSMTREHIRSAAPGAPATDTSLLALRQRLALAETEIADTQQTLAFARSERIRLLALAQQISDEITRIRKIIHVHETLALFSPDTCPCCLRPVDRAKDHCICGQPLEEASYQRFFYSSDEYLSILKSKQKNAETVSAALRDCDDEIARRTNALEASEAVAHQLRDELAAWAGASGTYSTELQLVDDELVEVRVELERLQRQLVLEVERDKLLALENDTRQSVARLKREVGDLEVLAQEERASKVAQFDQIYNELMRATLKDVHAARLDSDYEPVLNEREYREASSGVTKRLMYFATFLRLSLASNDVPFPRFVLVDTPETVGIDRDNLSRAIARVADIVAKGPAPSQVVLTTGPGKYPEELAPFRRMVLTDTSRLLQRRSTPTT